MNTSDHSLSDTAAAPAIEATGPVEIWTDGSCEPNPGRGGWAAILRGPRGTEKRISGAEAASTNNRMELTAAIRALEVLSRPRSVVLHSDSQYVVLGMTRWVSGWERNGWRKSDGKLVENIPLWQRLLAAASRHRVEWRWVRGHADDAMNVRVDLLAATARDSLR